MFGRCKTRGVCLMDHVDIPADPRGVTYHSSSLWDTQKPSVMRLRWTFNDFHMEHGLPRVYKPLGPSSSPLYNIYNPLPSTDDLSIT
jgi:hypothetical protein